MLLLQRTNCDIQDRDDEEKPGKGHAYKGEAFLFGAQAQSANRDGGNGNQQAGQWQRPGNEREQTEDEAQQGSGVVPPVAVPEDVRVPGFAMTLPGARFARCLAFPLLLLVCLLLVFCFAFVFLFARMHRLRLCALTFRAGFLLLRPLDFALERRFNGTLPGRNGCSAARAALDGLSFLGFAFCAKKFRYAHGCRTITCQFTPKRSMTYP